MESRFRDLPSVNEVLDSRQVGRLVGEYSRDAVLGLVRSEIESARDAIRNGHSAPDLDTLAGAVERRASSLWRSLPTPVINATGVILHTNLGRAPLSDDSIEAMRAASEGYGDLEFDLQSGRRGSRQGRVGRLLCLLTGAEAALVVNNNASAVLLGAGRRGERQEVIVSRGEAVEIAAGSASRDVLRQSGATLVEVGTTNKTYVRDYEAAINENTGPSSRFTQQFSGRSALPTCPRSASWRIWARDPACPFSTISAADAWWTPPGSAWPMNPCRKRASTPGPRSPSSPRQALGRAAGGDHRRSE